MKVSRRQFIQISGAAAAGIAAQRRDDRHITAMQDAIDDMQRSIDVGSFDTTAAYREWCARHLPSWLGYGPAV